MQSLTPANEVWDKVIFFHLSVILFLSVSVPGVGLCTGEVSVPGDSVWGGFCPWGSLSGGSL